MAVAQGERRVLPVWHGVDAEDVVRASPMLADLVGVRTRRGLNAVAEEVIRASFPDRLDSLPVSNTGRESSADLREALATLTGMLDDGASRDDVFLLVSAYHDLLRAVARGGLVESGNVHHAHPDRWRFSITLLNGRRASDPSALARRNELASTSRIPLHIASYDRLTDLDVSRIRR